MSDKGYFVKRETRERDKLRETLKEKEIKEERAKKMEKLCYA